MSEQPQKQLPAPVAKGQQQVKKKSIGHKLAETFFSESIDNVGEYVSTNIIWPSIKKLIVDGFTGAINMLFYGNGAGGASNPNVRTPQTNYAGMYNNRQAPSVRNRNLHVFDDVIFQTRQEAEEVLNGLGNLVAQYGAASVADFYALSNLDSAYTDRNWGWTNLTGTTITWMRDGYLINLPRAVSLR